MGDLSPNVIFCRNIWWRDCASVRSCRGDIQGPIQLLSCVALVIDQINGTLYQSFAILAKKLTTLLLVVKSPEWLASLTWQLYFTEVSSKILSRVLMRKATITSIPSFYIRTTTILRISLQKDKAVANYWVKAVLLFAGLEVRLQCSELVKCQKFDRQLPLPYLSASTSYPSIQESTVPRVVKISSIDVMAVA